MPAHPIAGAEKSGAEAASAGLFRERRVVLTPLAENSESAVKRVHAAWSACGARITRMDPEEHDAVLGAVSHLPHVLAYALVHEFATREGGEQLFDYAAGGFRDFTRIASSHPEMWRDICIANSDRLLEELRRYRKKLDAVGKLLEAGDGAALEKLFAEARAARDNGFTRARAARARVAGAYGCRARRASPIACCCSPRSGAARPRSGDCSTPTIRR